MLRTYTIINVADITPGIIKDCIQDSILTVRKDKTKGMGILKWEGETPEWAEHLQCYTLAEIQEEMKKNEWQSEEPV